MKLDRYRNAVVSATAAGAPAGPLAAIELGLQASTTGAVAHSRDRDRMCREAKLWGHHRTTPETSTVLALLERKFPASTTPDLKLCDECSGEDTTAVHDYIEWLEMAELRIASQLAAKARRLRGAIDFARESGQDVSEVCWSEFVGVRVARDGGDVPGATPWALALLQHIGSWVDELRREADAGDPGDPADREVAVAAGQLLAHYQRLYDAGVADVAYCAERLWAIHELRLREAHAVGDLTAAGLPSAGWTARTSEPDSTGSDTLSSSGALRGPGVPAALVLVRHADGKKWWLQASDPTARLVFDPPAGWVGCEPAFTVDVSVLDREDHLRTVVVLGPLPGWAHDARLTELLELTGRLRAEARAGSALRDVVEAYRAACAVLAGPDDVSSPAGLRDLRAG